MNKLEIVAAFKAYIKMMDKGMHNEVKEIMEDVVNEACGKEIYKHAKSKNKKTASAKQTEENS